MRIFCQNFSKNELFLSILTKNHGSGSLNQKNASHQFIWALLMLETQYLVKLESLGVEKKWCGNFWNFEILPRFWPKNGQIWARIPIFYRFRAKMGGKSQNFQNSRTTFFSTPKDSNLTKYWVSSINRAQMNWCEAFLWFKLPDPWFLVRIDKNRSFFEKFRQNMRIPPKKLLFFHTYHITTTFKG